jgi:beta-N-acetylhexosaminidase
MVPQGESRRQSGRARASRAAIRCRRLLAVLGVLAVVAIIAVVVPGLSSSKPDPAPAPDPTAGLSVAQLTGQRVIASFRAAGARPPRVLLRRIRRGELAGVVLFAQNGTTAAALRRVTVTLQAHARRSPIRAPLLVMLDQEGGRVKRLPAEPPRRSAAQLGALGSRSAARAEGLATARALRRAGVNVDLAPVADVARPGSAMLREGRSFGGPGADVGGLAGAFAAGLRAGGVEATAKHFPGFGAARANTDDVPVTIGVTRAWLRRLDEPPFRAAIRQGTRLVMLANATYAALDRAAPATLSRAIATGELRARLRFAGVSVTDDLEASALRRFGGPGRIALRSARAGADLLLFGRSAAAGLRAAQALERAAVRGDLDMAELRASARRVLELRASLGR